MSDKKLFCIGYGYSARALARQLRSDGWRIAGTTTSVDKAAAMNADSVDAHLWRDNAFDPTWLDGADAILVSTPPGDAGCPALTAAGDAIAAHSDRVGWVGYLSTNGVYGDHDGAWVDETSELRATSARAKRRIQTETDWKRLATAHGLPLTIFRLPGIYGPGRSALDNIREGRARRIFKKGQVFSRMHVDDIAAALKASIATPSQYNLYNLADDDPAPPQDVVKYAALMLGRSPPPIIPIEDAALSEMAKSFYADNKRVSNKRMKDALGVTLRHPNYREGLSAILKQELSAG